MNYEVGSTRINIRHVVSELRYHEGGDIPILSLSGNISNGQIFYDPHTGNNQIPSASSWKGVENEIFTNNNENENNEDSSNAIPTKGGDLGTIDPN